MRVLDFISFEELIELGFTQIDSTEVILSKKRGDYETKIRIDFVKDLENHDYNSIMQSYYKNDILIIKSFKIKEKNEIIFLLKVI